MARQAQKMRDSGRGRPFWWVWIVLTLATTGLLPGPWWSASWAAKGEGGGLLSRVKLDVTGYVKTFTLVYTRQDHFLPATYPAGLEDLERLARLDPAYKPHPKGLQGAWDELRREVGTNATALVRARLRLKVTFGSSASLHVHYELRPMVRTDAGALLGAVPVVGGMATGMVPVGAAGGFGPVTLIDDRPWDLPRALFDNSSFRLEHEIDRLFFTVELPFADVSLGRQPVSLGVGKVFRPTDLFAPFSPQEVDQEDRRGADSLKVEIPVGDVSEITIAAGLYRASPWIPRDQATDNTPRVIAVARAKVSALGMDLSALGGYARGDVVGGLAVSGSLLGAGVRAEAALFAPDDGADIFVRVSAGVDYNVAKANLYLALEYFYNGSGATSAAGYVTAAGSPRLLRGEVFCLGAHYAALVAQWQAHPLVKLTLMSLVNLQDPSVLLAPQVEVGMKQDVYLLAGAYFGLGARPKTSIQGSTLNTDMESEYGAAGWSFVLGLRVYY